ncbi:MAG TPA: type VI secretion system-associated FHA domain protein TagH [Dongiaceae bacterium]|nr:type VI secretion system-associated FHA domain protein TagH [Dongiaceae bacterium]
MELVLEVISAERHRLGENASYRFTPAGGVIGRSSECDWVIPDQTRHLSGRHAIISYEAGQYFITDISTNGTYLNGPDPLTRNVAKLLHDEDRLLMGEIQLRVRLSLDYLQPQRPAPVLQSNPLMLDDQPLAALAEDWDCSEVGMGSRPRQRPYRQPSIQPALSAPLAAPVPPVVAPVTPLPVSGSFRPALKPVPVSEPELAPIPATVDVAAPLPPMQSPPLPSSPSAAADAMLAAFASGAGLPLEAIRQAGAEAVLQRAGAALRLCLQGLVTNAQARASMKNEFHLDMTLMNAQDNNPLKFAANAEQVLRHLLTTDEGSFMPLEAGVQECFDDVQLHQQAMLAGMQDALQELLLTLSPASLQQRVEQKRSGPSLRSKDARYWAAYRELHRDLQAEENLFDSLFADTFARAYEELVLQQKKSPPKKR